MFQIDLELPKITCLLVTANGRIEYFSRSFACYLNQTYPNRELLIVNEGPKSYQEDIKRVVGDHPNVRFVFLDNQYYTLGALRNISISLADGDLFVQWDDDDFNMPDRLMVQYSYLAKHPDARVCYLTDQLHYYFPTQELFWENWEMFLSGNIQEFSLIPGTLMAYKSGFDVRYPSSGIHARAGEDSVLAHQLCEQGKVILLRHKGYLHVYSYHGKNVFDIEHHRGISRHRSVTISTLLKNRDRIAATMDFLQLGTRISVSGRDGVAFIHEVKCDK